MEAGTIAQWNVKEGDSFEAGSVVAEIETDKATMGFEAQDPGVVAKILVQAGSEIKVGTAIMVIVDDTDSATELVAAFAGYVAEAAPEAAAPAAPPVAAAPVAAAPVAAAPVAAAPVAAPPVAAPTPAPVVAAAPAAPAAAPPAPAAAPAQAVAPAVTAVLPTRWGSGVRGSALSHKLATDQHKYIDLYGSTGQFPMD